ncbi:MAG: hypothetical protein ACREQ8_18895 [Woeseiaceae bacterium]
MINKTFWIGFIVVYIVWQLIGFVVHGIMLEDTYANMWQVFRPEGEMNSMMWMMFLSSALYLLLFCYIFTKGYEGKGVGEGLRYGLLMGLFMAIPMSIDQYVVYPVPSNLAVIWFLSGVISFMIAGAIFAAIYKANAGATRLAAAT